MFALNFLLTRLSRVSFFGLMLLTIVLLTNVKLQAHSVLTGQQLCKENSIPVHPFTTISFEENEEYESQNEFDSTSDFFFKNSISDISLLKFDLLLATRNHSEYKKCQPTQLFIRLRKILI